MKRILICLTGSLFFLLPLAAQNYSVGTNVADYAGFGTMNITASAALSPRSWPTPMRR